MKFLKVFALVVILAIGFVSCEKQGLKTNDETEIQNPRVELDATCKLVDSDYAENGYEGRLYEDVNGERIFLIEKSN